MQTNLDMYFPKVRVSKHGSVLADADAKKDAASSRTGEADGLASHHVQCRSMPSSVMSFILGPAVVVRSQEKTKSCRGGLERWPHLKMMMMGDYESVN